MSSTHAATKGTLVMVPALSGDGRLSKRSTVTGVVRVLLTVSVICRVPPLDDTVELLYDLVTMGASVTVTEASLENPAGALPDDSEKDVDAEPEAVKEKVYEQNKPAGSV